MTAPQEGLVEAVLADPWWGDTTMQDSAWRAAFNAVPRHLFAPDTWYEWADGAWTARHRADDEDAWLRAVYTVDKPFVTQIAPSNAPSCSLSAPFLVSAMLGALDLKPGMSVLESGAGCGWTAALMATYVGGTGSVTSVEYDEVLAEAAQQNIDRVGLHASVHAGDGTAGWPPSAPYDRVSATHSVWRIPKAWIAQCRPGGLLCAPLAVTPEGLDLYVRLIVRDDGSASGPVMFPLAFMRSRSETRPADARWTEDVDREGTTSLDLPAIIADDHAWVLRLGIPGLRIIGPREEDGDDCVWLSTPDGSWAVGYVPAGKPWTDADTGQHGPRDVWTEAERTWAQWESAGRPNVDGYGLTVESDGTHRLWIGDEDNVVAELP